MTETLDQKYDRPILTTSVRDTHRTTTTITTTRADSVSITCLESCTYFNDCLDHFNFWFGVWMPYQ